MIFLKFKFTLTECVFIFCKIFAIDFSIEFRIKKLGEKYLDDE
jgi:hypothetical protein